MAGLLAALLLAACGGGSGSAGSATQTDAPLTCAQADQRSWLNSYMADQYYWFDRLGQPNEAALDMDSYFHAMLYQTLDRYSYSESSAEYNQFFNEGVFTGYGYSLAWSDAAQTVLKVRQVEPLSPVGQAGLKRGETIVSIDGYSPAQIVAGDPGRVKTAGIPRTFVVSDADHVTRTFSVNSAVYRFVSVPVSSVLTLSVGAAPVKVAYMVYQQFVSSSAGELAAAFNAFAASGVKELIVDLRYNGGGSISVARNLASMMGGSALDGKTFVQMRYNAKHAASNSSYLFGASTATLPAAPLEGLARVIIIGSEATSSASELVINSLKPFIPVVLIGATTYGKPYGFQPVQACDITYSAVNFESFNALGQGGYNNGITPDCAVADDLDHQLGDSAEGRLAVALSYIQNGSCPVSAAPAGAMLRAVGAGRSRLNTAFGEVPAPRMRAD